jgi:chromatin assembly factor 1 subunit B
VANGKAAEAVERKTDGTEQEKAELKVEEIGEATPPTNAPGRLAQALHNEEMATHGDSVDTMTAAKTTTTVVAAAGTAAGGLEVAGGDAPTAEAEARISLEPAKAFDLPYRVIFCVCTTDTVAVYDTSEESPVAFVGGLHYAAITDAAWSPDGRTLVVSSSDGYCSVLSFTEAELGRALTPEEVPKHVREQLPERRVRAAEEAAREAVAAAARVAQARIAAAAHAAAAAAAAAAVAEAVSSAATATGEVTAAEAVPAAAAATATGVAARRIAPVPTGIDASTSASASARRMAPMPMSVDGGGGASASTAASSGAPRRIMPQPANASAPAADLSTPAPAASARRIAPQSMGAPVNAPVPVRLQPETTSPGEKRPRDVGAVQGETGAEETGASKSSKSGIAPTAC